MKNHIVINNGFAMPIWTVLFPWPNPFNQLFLQFGHENIVKMILRF